ncbi:MAG: hypothetical protein ACLRZ9_09010 [Eubacterium sp.]
MKIYKFADIPVGVYTRGEYFDQCCVDYLAESEQAKFNIGVNDEDLAYEQSRTEEEVQFSKSYLEFIALYRQFCEKVIDYGVVLCHGSVVKLNGKAYMFSAPSGTGKSTHARMWRQLFGEKVTMINDDKPLLKFENDGIYAYGTPWDGKHRLSTNTRAKLAGICFLHQAEKNSIRRIDASESIDLIMNQIYRPRNTDGLMKTLDYVEKLIEKIPMYVMGCTISEEAAEMAYNVMNKEK